MGNREVPKKRRRRNGKIKYEKSYIRGLLFSLSYAFVCTFYRRNIRQALVLIGIILVAAGGFVALPYLIVEGPVTMEAGGRLPAVDEFLRWKNQNASFATDPAQEVDVNAIGEYTLLVHVYDRNIPATLCVADTTPPVVETRPVTIFSGEEVSTEDFIAQISDVTATTVAFAGEVDTDTAGETSVELVVEDEGKNVTRVTAALTVCVDEEPPVITGVTELRTTQGGTISYKKGVEVTDNLDADVKLEIDNSQVNLDVAGTYDVIYTATDSAGNSTSVTTQVIVERPSIENVTQESVNQVADELLASILTDDMSQYEKAQKIYWWCHDNIAYVDGTPKENPVKGAYRGLVNRRGDCYTYAMTAKILLTQAGISNMDIERIPSGNSMHYWNLVDIGEGWYHFDTCRRADGSTFFYKTDAEIKAYSDAHNGTHNYDRSLYPTIN